jgi:hypothetical protein|tara:strand:+ start:10820 stop:12169 length:1350 start_codon:yes stop_codon:yes gene_type:complete
MAAFKQFNTNQVVITPFFANKDFTFVGSEVTASDVGIEYYQTTQVSAGNYPNNSSFWVKGANPTGFTTILDSGLVFNNVKQLYYSNYLTESYGDVLESSSLIAGVSPKDDSYVGITTGPRFDNFLQSSLTQTRYFAQFSSSEDSSLEYGPAVISIPSKLFGEKIPPSTFNFEYTSSINNIKSFVHDDGEGNLIATQSNSNNISVFSGSVGQIFYSQGIAVLTGPDPGNLRTFPHLLGSTNGSGNNNIESASISFSSSITIRENQYKCTIRDNEYSYTLNPSVTQPINQLSKINNQLLSSIIINTYADDGDAGIYTFDFTDEAITGVKKGVGGTINITIAEDGTISNITVLNPGTNYKSKTQYIILLGSIPNASGNLMFELKPSDIFNLSSEENPSNKYYDFATGSYFSPYVTTIGLYNEAYQLVAVGKLAQPIPISLHTDTTFIVNYDT